MRTIGGGNRVRGESNLSDIDVLYIRSHNNLVSDGIVPLGAVTNMNAARAKKLGVYASECTDAQIRSARLVAVDWHWAFTLPAARAICERVRRVQPDAAVVVGGLTAGLFGERAFGLLPADFLLTSDTEPAFARLAAGERDVSKLPNVLDSRGGSGPRRRLSREEFDALDPVTVDWFPSFDRSQSQHVFLSRGCDGPCRNHCLCRTIGEDAMIHSPEWTSRVLGSLRRGAKSTNVWSMGVDDADRLIGVFDRLMRPIEEPVNFYCCHMNARWLESIHRHFPNATASLIAPWDREKIGIIVDASLKDEREDLRRIWKRGLKGEGVRIYCHGLERTRRKRGGALLKSLGLTEESIMPVDNWLIWAPQDSARGGRIRRDAVRGIEALAGLVARSVPLSVMVPGLRDHYPIRESSHAPPARRPPHRVLRGFHAAVRRAWRRWHTTLLPADVRYEAWLTSDPGAVRAARASALSLLGPGAGRNLGPAGEPRIAPDGIVLESRFDAPGGRARDWTALTVLPRDIRRFARLESLPVAAVPVPPAPAGARVPLEVSLRVTARALEYRVNWTGARPVRGEIEIGSTFSRIARNDGGRRFGMKLGVGALRCRLSRQKGGIQYAAGNGEWCLSWEHVPDHEPDTESRILAAEKIVRRQRRGTSLEDVFAALAAGVGAPVVPLS